MWKPVFEQAAVGFLGTGALCLLVSRDPLHFLLLASCGALLHAGYAYLRPLPWKRYFQDKTSACVSVTRDLYFREVSADRPDKLGFIRIQDVDRKELFQRLNGKMLDPATIPYHMRTTLEQRKSLDLPWEAVEPYLRPVPKVGP